MALFFPSYNLMSLFSLVEIISPCAGFILFINLVRVGRGRKGERVFADALLHAEGWSTLHPREHDPGGNLEWIPQPLSHPDALAPLSLQGASQVCQMPKCLGFPCFWVW